VSEVTAVTSVLPGALVQSLITAVFPWGLNAQVLGFFGGTLDRFHLNATDIESKYKIGQKVQSYSPYLPGYE
jgi:rRNA biogenesis protein RRP5